MYSETTTPQNNYFADELTPKQKKLLSFCHNQTLLSPLEACRALQEDAKGQKYRDLCKVERYLINE